VYVKDLMQFVVRSAAETASVLAAGRRNRSVGATLMNQDSSRSHSIFTITVEATERAADGGGGGGGSGGGHIRVRARE
jgi:kinesin family protein 3/17